MQQRSKEVIVVENDGTSLVASNYWQSEYARHGYCSISTNAGTIRQLLPAQQASYVAEMRSAKYVIFSVGPFPRYGREMVELLFEDDSDAPFCFHVSTGQCDCLPKSGENWRFACYGDGPRLLLEMPCHVRKVEELPCLQSLNG